ncbi:MAG TPA: methionine aminotransferase [Ginsengibacter sp.]|nr:aminotransferase class I/II-fold pyridoxal phosphate-dependent enzyme [Chitinophagales bacterium]HRN72524.1 methionine aminotransferase [Ginsengibacter sp.]HRP17177.1 methionine aminotransferase [Ginsengibacter sp.]HRP43302.1 methionine aminotransferase [Ginsengibacter sp.]
MLKGKIDVGETIFTTMSRLSSECGAINLGQGFPDYPMDGKLVNLLTQAMEDGHNQYAPLAGIAPLRKAIAEKIDFLYGLSVDPETEVCVTPGATYAIYTAFTTVLHEGDEVIVFEPAYDSYIPNIEINGGRPVLIPLSAPDFKIDWERVREAITPRTKMIIINNPHNPSGMLLSATDMVELSDLVLSNGLYLLSDEVYEHLVFDNQRFESVLRYPELFQRSFVTYSFGKVYHCTGWKTGYCIAPEKLMTEFKKVHQYNAFCCFSPVQFALATYLGDKEAYLGLGKFFEPKRDLLESLLSAVGLKPIPSKGSFFQLYDYSDLSNEDELSYVKRLTVEAGVSAIPVSSFYADKRNQGLLRFCFAKEDATLREAGARLKAFFES